MNFKDFKKQKAGLKKAISKVSEDEKSKSNRVETYFPKVDKNGNGYSIVRFLPQPNTDKMAYLRMAKHGSKTASSWLSMFCPTSFGKPYADCPLCAIAGAEYKRQKDAGVERPQGITEQRKWSTVINVLVIEDDNQPDLVGTVLPMFLGRDILAKIDKKLFPKKRGDVQPEAEIIYDLWEGRNFTLDISKGSNGYPDYSECVWASEKTPVASSEKKIEEIYKQLIDLDKQYHDETKLLSADKMIEKWDAFHSSGGGKSIDEKRKDADKQAEKDIDKKETEKEKEKEHSESFSTNDTSDNEKKIDNDDCPW